MAVKQAERIPTTILLESLRKAQDFPNDLNIILEKGNIKRVRLAKALGVSRRELYRWRKGISQPQSLRKRIKMNRVELMKIMRLMKI